jgi:uncharacterized integral membrane protein
MLFIIGIILGAVVIIFILQNMLPVTVSFFSWETTGSLAVLLILAIIAGMIISWLLAIPQMIRQSSLRAHAKKLEEDLNIHKQKLSETEGKLSQAEAPVVLEKTVVVDREI